MENRLQDLALAAILEFDAIPGLWSGKHLTRSLSVSSASTPISEAPDAFQKQLTDFYNLLCFLGVDFAVLLQVFKQVSSHCYHQRFVFQLVLNWANLLDLKNLDVRISLAMAYSIFASVSALSLYFTTNRIIEIIFINSYSTSSAPPFSTIYCWEKNCVTGRRVCKYAIICPILSNGQEIRICWQHR